MKSRELWLATTVAWAALMATPAMAQTADAGAAAEIKAETDRDVIVVTARKREERLIDVPSSVSVIGGGQLEREQIRSVTDFVQAVPGVQMVDAGSRERRELVIRGAGASRLLNTDSPNGIYRNGGYVGGGSFGGRNLSRMDLFDLERIEVLRGPQGSLYGRNAVGGAVNLITRKPVFEQEGRIEAAVAEFNRWEALGVFNAPLVEDRLAIRVGAEFIDQSEGSIRNTNTVFNQYVDPAIRAGEYIDIYEYAGLRFSALAIPSDRLTANFTIDYYDETGPGYGAGVFDAGGGPGGLAGQVRAPQQPYVTSKDTLDTTEIEDLNANLTLDWRLDGGMTLTSVTQVRDRSGRTLNDLDSFISTLYALPPLPAFTPVIRDYRGEYQAFGQELRLSGEFGSGGPRWLIGAEYQYAEDNLRELIYAPNQLLLDWRNAPSTDPDQAFKRAVAQGLSANITDDTIPVETQSFAIFGSVEHDLTERLTGALELRATWDEKTQNTVRLRGVSVADATNGLFPVTQIPFCSTGNDCSSAQWDNLSPGASLTYRVNDDARIYARYATAYRAGGFPYQRGQWTTQPDPTPDIYDQESVQSVELGTKISIFGGDALLEAAVYQNWYSDILINTSLNDQATIPLRIFWVENGGDAEMFGAELQLNGSFDLTRRDRLDYGIGLSHQSSEFTSTDPRLANQTLRVNGVNIPLSLNGLELPRLRDFQAAVSLSYERDFSDSVSAFLGATANFETGGVIEARPGVYGTSPNQFTAQRDADDVSLIDLRTGLDVGDWSVLAEVKNVTDETYFLVRAPAATNRENLVNDPRTWSVRVARRF